MVVDHFAWQRVAEADDPFASMRTPEHMCPEPGFTAEFFGGIPSIEVWTQECNFISLQQPLLDDLREGADFQVRLWHFALTSPVGGEAYLALQVADTILWERRIPIPTEEGQLLDDTVELPIEAAAGDPIVFHLHNHGMNSYNLLEVQEL